MNPKTITIETQHDHDEQAVMDKHPRTETQKQRQDDAAPPARIIPSAYVVPGGFATYPPESRK